MTQIFWRAVLTVLLSGAPWAMAPAEASLEQPQPATVSESVNGTAAPSGEMTLALEKAQKFYDEALALFKEGKSRQGNSRLRKAFAELAYILAREEFYEDARSDFESIVDKLKAIENAKTSESSSLLEVPEEELAVATATPAVMPKFAKMYTITVDPANALTQKFLGFYTSERRREVVAKALARSGRYREMILNELKNEGLPSELFYLVMVESEFNAKAYSRAGAAGLWQLMPATARKLGLKVNYWLDERFDPQKSTKAALRYLKELYHWFDDWHLALAAYNRGEHGIGRDLQYTRATDFTEVAAAQAPPMETRHFVPKFMACVLLGENPRDYGFYPRYETPEPYEEVAIDKPLDLKIAAQCAGANEETLRRLNPAVRAWCTPKGHPNFILRVPAGSRQSFLQNLAQVKDWNPRPDVLRYRVQRGDALSVIARRYKTTVAQIKQENNLSNTRFIRAGQVLRIRPGRQYYER